MTETELSKVSQANTWFPLFGSSVEDTTTRAKYKMDDSMIGRWLSEIPMGDPAPQSWSKPQLRRFVHFDKPIRFVKLIGKGTEALVFLVEVEGIRYAIKMVSWCYDSYA